MSDAAKRQNNIVSVRITDEELEMLQEVGTSSCKSVSELLKEAFRCYLDQCRSPEGAHCHEGFRSKRHESHCG